MKDEEMHKQRGIIVFRYINIKTLITEKMLDNSYVSFQKNRIDILFNFQVITE